ncbi:integrase core domain protein [Trichonephila clavata]|uniref:Integrase core domain protein n=1 Tax=Trichonephila clavata TaxID=2740835 RepID=A0A8X6KAN6_TRICU|nr:integrase core domain protein [Trichonephila clavata]
MVQAKFDLRGCEFTEAISLRDPKPTPVLRLLWDKSEDVLFCDNSLVEIPPDIVTRRMILSYANRFFDPIGFTCPVSLKLKVLLQESWQSKVSWDSEVLTDMKKTFLKWIEDIKMLHLVKIPRKFLIRNVSFFSFHVFCDLIQEESFTEESVKGLKTLNVLRDEESILRIKTKLIEKKDVQNFRYSILLPGKHRLVGHLVREAHLENSHAGV